MATAPLSRWQTLGVVGFFAFLIAFGGLVEYRSALLTRRMGDLDVFLRAAWAVRNDADLYTISSDNDWHYIYPPLYAILLTPLADPPRDADPTGHLPYALSVAIFYVINLLCLLWGVHRLASALEERSEDAGFRAQPKYCLRWWLLRLWPIAICFLPIGHTMMRGQVNVIVLAVLCLTLAGWIRGQSFRAGGWLALAICIKVIPAYLLIYPLWKRDWRAAGRLCAWLFHWARADSGHRVWLGRENGRPLRNLRQGLLRAALRRQRRSLARSQLAGHRRHQFDRFHQY